MRSGNALRTAVLASLVLFLVFGIHRLFALRFESGDIYAPYSSLRTDPLGCRALYDAFDMMPGLRAERHYLGLEDITADGGEAVFFLGLTPGQLGFTIRHEGEKLMSLAEGGARIVIALRTDPFPSPPAVDGERSDNGEKDEPPGKEGPEETDGQLPDNADERESDDGWGIEVGLFGKAEGARASLVAGSVNLPDSIPVYSRLYFRSDDETWTAVYTSAGKPVVLERAFGSGSIVLLSDSYLLSNEALRYEFFPDLLTWLMDGSSAALFDESHLGVLEDPGVMFLIRKYRLGGFLAVLVGLALLAAWKSAVPLVRVRGESVQEGAPLVTEKDQFSGLVNLLRRNIGPNEVLGVCQEEWKRSFGGKKAGLYDSRDEDKSAFAAEGAVPGKKEDPVKAYNRITALLAERKGR